MKHILTRLITSKYVTGRFSKSICTVLGSILVIWLIWITACSPFKTINHQDILPGKFGNHVKNGHFDIDSLVSLKEDLDYLKLSDHASPFKLIEIKQKEWHEGKLGKKCVTKSELKLLKNWHHGSKRKQCGYLIASIYDQIPDWNNMDMFNYYEDDDISRSIFELIVERLRIYDYCFLNGDENIIQVFKDDIITSRNISIEDFNVRMFPLFNSPNVDDKMMSDTTKKVEFLWPHVYNIDPLKNINEMKIPLPDYLKQANVHEYNMNFWRHWVDASIGKGIVTTMHMEDLPMFKKFVAVLAKQNNILPIQVVTTGTEMKQEFTEALHKISKQYNQRIQLVDCTPVINTLFSEHKFYGFLNKLAATLFNTFEEAILIDLDVIPFISPIEFFDIERYKETGMYLYRDRRLSNMLPDTCRQFMRALEPSIQEKQLIGTKIKYDKKWSSEHKGIDIRHLDSEEDVVYKNYMHYQEFHAIDSGLVIFNKKKHFASLLMSTYMGFDIISSGCSWGDKELFWLGSIYGGDEFGVAPKEGAIVGELQQDAENENKYSICSAQMAHVDEGNRLLWINGGLKICKFENEAKADFKRKPEYFEQRYGNVETLQRLQNESIRINAIIVPDVWYSEWLKIQECRGYTYCYTLDLAHRDVSDYSYIVKYSSEQLEYYNSISAIWNAA